jgi:predicted ArsR family transcriptional regulator
MQQPGVAGVAVRQHFENLGAKGVGQSNAEQGRAQALH